MARRFVEIFNEFNADIAATIRVDSMQSLLHLASSFNEDTAIRNMDLLLDILKTQTQYGVLYIFDEHDEFYSKPDQGKSALDYHGTFLGRFTRWTGPTAGVSHLSIDTDI